LNKFRQFAYTLILISAFLIPINIVAAETAGQYGYGSDPRAAQYFLGDRDGIFITINVWGKVHKPGQYNVPSGTDLLTLISAAGGPNDRSRLDNIRIVRLANQRQEIIEVDVREYLKTGNSSLIPEMKPGDTVIVSGSAYNVIAYVVDVMAKVGILLNAIVLMQRLK
jgi:hypothetical protein